MLIQFKIKNFRSFRDEQTLSLVASPDKSHQDNLIQANGLSLLKCAAIYGSNASGKSNLLAAMGFMAGFVRNSAGNMNLGAEIWVEPFRLDRDSAQAPSTFEITLSINGTLYVYGFSATREQVQDEWLLVRAQGTGSRLVQWLDRRWDSAARATKWTFRGPLKADAKLLSEKTRPNGLVLSRAADLNIGAVHELFLWFQNSVGGWNLADHPSKLIERTASRVASDAEFRNRILKMLRDADLSIDDISISAEPIDSSIPNGVPEEPRSAFDALHGFLKKLDPKPEQLKVLTRHRVAGTDEFVTFDLNVNESNGTRRLFALGAPILDALDAGSLLVIDELECSMHPLLTRKLIELFQSAELNKKGAQLIFATQDSSLMNQHLFRRDQLWLVQKNSAGSSEIFSLYDFSGKERPRHSEAFERNYLAGKYGGVPRFGRLFEDLEEK